MVDTYSSDAGLSPEEVANKRDQAKQLFGVAQRYPGGGLLGALAMAYAGYRGGEEDRSAAEGERSGRRSLTAALMGGGDAKARLGAVMASPYGAGVGQKIAGDLLSHQLEPPKLGTAGQNEFGQPVPVWVDQANQRLTPAQVSPGAVPSVPSGPSMLPGSAAPSASPQGASAGAEAGRPVSELTGDELLGKLKGVSPSLPNIIKGIAEGRQPPLPQGRGNMRNQQIMAWVAQYDPTFDLTQWTARNSARKEFNSGGLQSPAAQITAGNTAIKHLDELSDAATRLNNADSGIPGNNLYNWAGNEIARWRGQAANLKAFEDIRERYISEITKFYRGSPGNEADITRAIGAFSSAGSPSELQAVARAEGMLMKDKVGALQERWKNAMGPGARDFPILHTDTQGALDRIQQRYKAATGGASPAAAGAAPSQAAPPPPEFIAQAKAAGIPPEKAAAIPENGWIANPKTGKKFWRVGGKLVDDESLRAADKAAQPPAASPMPNPLSNFNDAGQFQGAR